MKCVRRPADGNRELVNFDLERDVNPQVCVESIAMASGEPPLSGPRYRGSNPCFPATKFLPQTALVDGIAGFFEQR